MSNKPSSTTSPADADTPGQPYPRLARFVAFGALLLFAFLIRFHNLGTLPSGLFCDEASNGLEALSLLQTGRSLNGDLLPMFFMQHAKNPIEGLYIYLTTPFVALFGLSAWTVRLVAALAGTALVATTFLAARALKDNSLAWFTAMLAAVSPWEFALSRVGFRGILAPVLIMLGLWGFLRMFERKNFAFVAALGFGLALHSYSVTKAFVPLAFLAMSLLVWPELKAFLNDRANRRTLLFAAGLFLALSIPVYWFSLLGPGNARFEALSVGTASHPALAFLSNFFAHLSPRFLLIAGDANGRHTPPGTGGVLLLTAAPLVLVGLIVAIVRRDRRLLLAPALFLIGIVPSALTHEGIPHALRAITAAPFAHILTAFGALSLLDIAEKRVGGMYASAVAISIVAILLTNAAWFMSRYYMNYPAASRQWFQYGMAQAIEVAENSPHERVVLSGAINMGYVFPLFYGSADIKAFQEREGKYLGERYVWMEGGGLAQLTHDGPVGERWLLIGHPAELPEEPGMLIKGRYDIPYVKIAEREF
ncbi:MAG: ArnT family glycosyltransferase [Candidatus Sumerlaeota bacterium]